MMAATEMARKFFNKHAPTNQVRLCRSYQPQLRTAPGGYGELHRRASILSEDILADHTKTLVGIAEQQSQDHHRGQGS